MRGMQSDPMGTPGWRPLLMLAASVLLGAPLANSWAEPVAKVEMADGTTYLKRPGGQKKILARGSEVEVGDTVSTERDSYVKLRFLDGAEMAVRPSSSIRIGNYHFKQTEPDADKAALKLLKGGVRTVTGLIGKRGNQDAYELQGGTSTIGIRGTDFTARLCNPKCEDDGKAGRGASEGRSTPIVARLVESKGKTYATPIGGIRQAVSVGDPLYVGSSVEADPAGHAVLVYADQAKMVLNGGSKLTLTSVRINTKQLDKGRMNVDLVKGGMRMVTGLLGKANPENVQIDTTVATIGIRGTNFDVLCAAPGSQGRGEDPTASGPVECGGSLYAQTRDGAIEVTSGGHSVKIPKGQAGYVDHPGAKPELLAEIPRFMIENPSPKPEDVSIDMPALFGTDASTQELPGLYTEVKEGKIILSQQTGQSIFVQAGEIGFASAVGGVPFRLSDAPAAMAKDPWLKEMTIDPAACRAN